MCYIIRTKNSVITTIRRHDTPGRYHRQNTERRISLNKISHFLVKIAKAQSQNFQNVPEIAYKCPRTPEKWQFQ